MRRVDPRHRTLGQFFHDEIAAPLGEDVYIRLPEEIPNSRLAVLAPPGRDRAAVGVPPATHPGGNEPALQYLSRAHRESGRVGVPRRATCLRAQPRSAVRQRRGHRARASRTPTASSPSGGRELGLRQETLDLLAAPAIPPSRGFYDECMKARGVEFSLGFMKPCVDLRFGGARSYGSPGAGGAMGFADPEAGIGYAYVTSQMGTVLTGDPRDVALRDALTQLWVLSASAVAA